MNRSRELLWLKANLVKGFFLLLFMLLPCFSARSLNHSSLHRYMKLFWLPSRGGAGVSVSSSLYNASQVASRSGYEALYFSTILFSRTLGTHLACVFSLMNYWCANKTGSKSPCDLMIGSICWREQWFQRFEEQIRLLCRAQVLQQNFMRHRWNCFWLQSLFFSPWKHYFTILTFEISGNQCR